MQGGELPDMLKWASLVDVRKRGIKMQIGSSGPLVHVRHNVTLIVKIPRRRNCPWLETSRRRRCMRSMHNRYWNTIPTKGMQKHSSKPSPISYTMPNEHSFP